MRCQGRGPGCGRVTFGFWYDLKQYLVLEKYIEARLQLVDVYSKLVDVCLNLLEYPQSETGMSSTYLTATGSRKRNSVSSVTRSATTPRRTLARSWAQPPA